MPAYHEALYNALARRAGPALDAFSNADVALWTAFAALSPSEKEQTEEVIQSLCTIAEPLTWTRTSSALKVINLLRPQRTKPRYVASR